MEIGERSDGTPAPTSDKTSFKKKLVIASLVVGFIMNVVSLIMAILAWIQINEYTNEFEDIVGTWQTSPITSMVLIMSTASCPSGYTQALYGSWGGIYPACNCINKKPNTNSTSSDTSSCSSQQLTDGCFDAPGYAAVNTPLFIAGQQICFMKSGPDTLDRPQINSDGTCPAGSTLCGNSTKGEFAFCFPGQCPITDAWIGDVTASGNLTVNETAYALAGQLDSEAPVIAGNLALFTKRGGTLNITNNMRTQNCPVGGSDMGSTYTCSLPVYGFPLIDMHIYSALPCYLGLGNGWSGRSGEYGNMESTWQTLVGGDDYTRGYVAMAEDSGCSKQFDTRFVGVYGELEKNMYQPFSASWPNVNSGQIPTTWITTSTSYRWYLSYKHEVQWASASMGCPVTRNRVVSNAAEVKNLKAAQAALIALTVISFIFLGFVGCCVTLNIVQKDNDGKIEKGEEGYKTMCGLKIANYVMKVGMYSCVIASVVLAFGLVGVFADLTQTNKDGSVCTDALSLSSFQGLSGIIDGLSKKNVIQGFTNMADFFIEVFHQVVRCI